MARQIPPPQPHEAILCGGRAHRRPFAGHTLEAIVRYLAALRVKTLTMLRMSSEASTTPAGSMAMSVPTPIAGPTSARARARASLTLSPAHCSHKKDQHGWQHEAQDLARPLGSI